MKKIKILKLLCVLLNSVLFGFIVAFLIHNVNPTITNSIYYIQLVSIAEFVYLLIPFFIIDRCIDDKFLVLKNKIIENKEHDNEQN